MYKFKVGDVLISSGTPLVILVLECTNYYYRGTVLLSRFPEVISKVRSYSFEFVEEHFVCINSL